MSESVECILCGMEVDFSGEFGNFGFIRNGQPVHETCHLKEKIRLLKHNNRALGADAFKCLRLESDVQRLGEFCEELLWGKEHPEKYRSLKSRLKNEENMHHESSLKVSELMDRCHELVAENERLRALVEDAYHEGSLDRTLARSEHVNCLWRRSGAKRALTGQGEQGWTNHR